MYYLLRIVFVVIKKILLTLTPNSQKNLYTNVRGQPCLYVCSLDSFWDFFFWFALYQSQGIPNVFFIVYLHVP